jgi:putative addiction module antidote
MMKLKVRKIGNSLGVVLPKEILGSLNIAEGDELMASVANDGFRLSPFDPDVAEQIRIAEDIAQRYRNALRELAK